MTKKTQPPQDLKTILAEREQQARQQLNLTQHQAVFVARINTRGRYV
ncbi:host cell division inhibitor Icd-like protein [Seminibacterium arietis]|uniref:Host cell division inhibitor Icd-like protein n=1 Tax=Seminibacterium arietis TaxID=1173502 RepID=A0ABW3I7T2_9PAST